MAQLALKSGGRHSFIEDATQLAQIFNEDFGEMLSVVALEVEITVDCKPGVRPVRLLGREGDISGQKVVTTMNQIYSKQAQYVLLEVEVPATEEVNARDVATVSLAYLNLGTKTRDNLSSSVAARFSKSPAIVAKNVNKDVMISCVAQIGLENNRKATMLRDQGRIKEAEALLLSNGTFLFRNADRYKSDFLRQYGGFNSASAQNLDPTKWNLECKKMRFQHSGVQQGGSLRVEPNQQKQTFSPPTKIIIKNNGKR